MQPRTILLFGGCETASLQTYATNGAGPGLSTEKAYAQIERMIQGQATVLAYVDVLLVMAV